MNTVRKILMIKGKNLWVVEPNQTVFEALRRMADKDVGMLVVMDNDQMVGVISERDYARKIVLLGKYSRDVLVSEIMTRNIVIVHPDQTVNECIELMTHNRVRHLPVVENEQVIGVISIGDVVRDIIYEQKQAILELENQLHYKE